MTIRNVPILQVRLQVNSNDVNVTKPKNVIRKFGTNVTRNFRNVAKNRNVMREQIVSKLSLDCSNMFEMFQNYK